MRIRAYFELVRLPNIITAIGDPLAGFLFAGGLLSNWTRYAPILACSACLYAGGIALNDVCDARRDRTSRPGRPIPSGRIRTPSAILLVIVLLGVGMLSAALHAEDTFILATCLVGCIVLYDVALKATHAAPIFMGFCRALNLALGMVAVHGMAPSWQIVIAAALMWLYVASLTWFARTEEHESHRNKLALALAGLLAAVAGQAGLHLILPDTAPSQLVLLIGLVAIAAHHGCAAVRNPGPANTQRAVTVFLLGILVFDASLVWLARGPATACVVIALLIPATLLAKKFEMT